jgi:hypothetical protein
MFHFLKNILASDVAYTLVCSTLVQTVGETEASTHVHTNTHAFKYGSNMKGLTTPSPNIAPHPNFKELNKKSQLLKKDGYKAQGEASLPAGI